MTRLPLSTATGGAVAFLLASPSARGEKAGREKRSPLRGGCHPTRRAASCACFQQRPQLRRRGGRIPGIVVIDEHQHGHFVTQLENRFGVPPYLLGAVH